MDDLLARLEGDLLRIRALYRLARRRGAGERELRQLASLGKTFRTELDRFRSTGDPAERKEAVLAVGRILGRIDGWVTARGPDFRATWRKAAEANPRGRGPAPPALPPRRDRS